ncbi:hypothetical protein Vadar_022526 [Vaccinium darrowii]|nr:hypothetical protein Vadar_022526 [Vaccinium darrowii]
MGREIVRQESPKEPGKRSRLWHHKCSFKVLSEKTGTETIEGLCLDMDQVLEEDSHHLLKKEEEYSLKQHWSIGRPTNNVGRSSNQSFL